MWLNFTKCCLSDKYLFQEVPLVIQTHDADVMATLLKLKAEAEDRLGTRMRMVFSGATEAHLLAQEIGTLTQRYRILVTNVLTDSTGKAGVGVILNPARPYPATWDQRRM
jgi:hypothetical protein